MDAHGRILIDERKWLTRVLDAQLTHGMVLGHEFGQAPDEHWLTLPDLHSCFVARYTGELEADAELAQAITGRMLPALDTGPTTSRRLAACPGAAPTRSVSRSTTIRSCPTRRRR